MVLLVVVVRVVLDVSRIVRVPIELAFLQIGAG
jgi:hypothetical protein